MARVSIVYASVTGLLTRLLVFGWVGIALGYQGGFSCFVCMEWGKRECFLLAFLGMGEGDASFRECLLFMPIKYAIIVAGGFWCWNDCFAAVWENIATIFPLSMLFPVSVSKKNRPQWISPMD